MLFFDFVNYISKNPRGQERNKAGGKITTIRITMTTALVKCSKWLHRAHPIFVIFYLCNSGWFGSQILQRIRSVFLNQMKYLNLVLIPVVSWWRKFETINLSHLMEDLNADVWKVFLKCRRGEVVTWASDFTPRSAGWLYDQNRSYSEQDITSPEGNRCFVVRLDFLIE